MIGPELTGEDFSEQTREFEHKQQRKAGRPREIDAESLNHAVNELQFVLEQNWGVVGWLLRDAKSISDVRSAFKEIVHQNCRYLEPFTDDQAKPAKPNELRAIRKRLVELNNLHRRDYFRRQSAREAVERVSEARATDADPVKQVQIQAIVSCLEFKFQEADSLEQKSRTELEALQAQLKEREAYFAQTEILRFLDSSRRKFTPLKVASAMAGLPHVTARISCERCAQFGIKPSHGIAFDVFQTIERMVPEPIRDLGGSIETLREHLLNGPRSDLPVAAQLRKNWYFLESAIRSAARDTVAQRGSLTFRIFAEYSRTSTSHSAVDAALAEAIRIFKDDEDPELDQGPHWDPSRTSRTRGSKISKK